jgi:hypothetical protein
VTKKKKRRSSSFDGSIPWTRDGLIEALEISEDAASADAAQHLITHVLHDRGFGELQGTSHLYRWRLVEVFLARHIDRLRAEGLVFDGALDLRLLDVLARARYTRVPDPLLAADGGEDVFDLEGVIGEAAAMTRQGPSE